MRLELRAVIERKNAGREGEMRGRYHHGSSMSEPFETSEVCGKEERLGMGTCI